MNFAKKKISFMVTVTSCLLLLLLGSNVYAASTGEQLKEPESGWTRYYSDNEYLVYNGDWKESIEPLPAYGRLQNCFTEGAELTFRFTGTKLRIISPIYYCYTDAIMVYVDDVKIGEFNPHGTANLYTAIQFETTELEDTLHNCRIVVNEGSSHTISPAAWAFEAIDIDENGSLLEPSTSTVELQTAKQTVNLNSEISVDVVLNNVSDIYAEDIKLSYDTSLYEYIGYENVTGLQVYNEDHESTSGTLRFIVASTGSDNDVDSGDKVITLKFRAISTGEGVIDAQACRIADITNEWDIEEADCGEVTIVVAEPDDVNKSGEYTLLDLAIDAYYFNNFASVDTSLYNADVVENEEVDIDDLSYIVEQIMLNSSYAPNKN